MSILTQGQRVDKYTVEYAIKTNAYCETYRVADDDGNPFFLKLYIIKNLPQKLLNEAGDVLEIFYAKQLKHKNIISYIDSGTLMIPEGVCHYMVTIYFTGELLVEKVEREGPLSLDEAKRIFTGILEALKYMHEKGLFHNDITPHNIMLSSLTDGEPELIDMGHVSHRVGTVPPFDTADLDAAYCANSTFIGTYDESTDLFSAIAVFYFMLTGMAPWNINIEPGTPRAQATMKAKKIRRETSLDLDDIDTELHAFFQRGLSNKSDERYKSASVVLDLLDNPGSVKPPKSDSPSSSSSAESRSQRDSDENLTGIDVQVQHGSGQGFKDIAGMRELKDMLEKRVILVLRDKELAKEYRLSTPNGMLLYGPPGCGKSFFAEKFAEETGFAFIYVKASDLGSVYIHGTQGKIAQLFKLAEKNAPTVLCFDEFDAFVPDRDQDLGNHHAGEVNEFLTQLNNCSKRGIFVIASTNRPDMVDPAVLRTGRIDKLFYVPLPDKEARREMLALYMEGRPSEEIDFEQLAELSEGYVASDIAYIVNEAATIAAFNREKITQQLLETTIKSIKPSIRPAKLEEYEAMREKMEGIGRGSALPPVGFNTKNAE